VLEYIPKHGQQLADEVRKWGQWVKEQAEQELAEFYPPDPDGATPIAYLWARTIRCEGPGCGAEVPLLRSLWLCKKPKRKDKSRDQKERRSKVVASGKEHGGMNTLLADQLDRLAAVGDPGDLEVGVGQVTHQHVARVDLVLHDQHLGHGARTYRSGSGWECVPWP